MPMALAQGIFAGCLGQRFGDAAGGWSATCDTVLERLEIACTALRSIGTTVSGKEFDGWPPWLRRKGCNSVQGTVIAMCP